MVGTAQERLCPPYPFLIPVLLQNGLPREKQATTANKIGTIRSMWIISYRFPNISFAAIRPPPAISTAAIAIPALGLAKPARIRNAVESSGVA